MKTYKEVLENLHKASSNYYYAVSNRSQYIRGQELKAALEETEKFLEEVRNLVTQLTSK